MIKFDGMKAEASRGGSSMLPPGPYIAQIRAVHIDGAEPNQTLILRVDVTEGDYKDFFTNKYNADKAAGGQYAAKYKGDYKLRIPHPKSNSQYPDSDKRKFNDAIYRIEQSNPDYHWDGDETKLKGKAVGINMRAGVYNDRDYTSIGRLEIVEDIRKGLIKAMNPAKPRYSPDYQQQAQEAPAGFTPVEDDTEIPF